MTRIKPKYETTTKKTVKHTTWASSQKKNKIKNYS